MRRQKKMNPDIRYSGLIPENTVINPKKKRKNYKKNRYNIKKIEKVLCCNQLYIHLRRLMDIQFYQMHLKNPQTKLMPVDSTRLQLITDPLLMTRF